jgi:hypothetical protein
MQLQLKRLHFGMAPAGSVLAFKVRSASGAAVKAVLDCDTRELASWEWGDLSDEKTIEQALNDKGTHTLTFMVPFTAAVEGAVDVTVSINGKEKTLSLTGQKPDVGKGLAVVIVR